VVRTVSTLPGLSINTSGGRNDLLVRGGGPSENLYIINNIEIPNINHFGTQGTGSGSLSFINLDLVKNVSFSTGGFSSQYGDKMSSVLNLDLTRGRSDRFGGKALISATQYGLNLEGPISSKGNFFGSARQSYLDLIFKSAGFAFIPVYTDFNFVANYDLTDKDKLFFVGLAAIDKVDRDQSTEENKIQNAGILDNTQNQYITGLNYRHLLKNGYTDLTFNFNVFKYRFSQIDELQQEYFNSQADEMEFSTKLQHFWAINKNINLITGINYKRVINDNETFFADSVYDRNGRKLPYYELGVNQQNIIKLKSNKYAAFVSLDWQPIETLNLNFGLRADYYAFLNEKFYYSPRFAVKYNINSNNSIKFSTGIYQQSPSNVWIVNPHNKDLKALKNNMQILGWDYLIRKDYRFAIETFYKNYSNLPTGIIPNVTDYIVINNTGGSYGGQEDDFQSFGYFDMVSTGKGKAYGLELIVQKKYSKTPFFSQISLSLIKSENTAGNGITYPNSYDQRFILNINGGYILNSKWEFSGKFRYFTGLPYTPTYKPSQNPVNAGYIQNLPEEYLSGRLASAHHLDLRVDRYFTFKSTTLIVFLDIQNIYNYQIPTKPRYDFWEDSISNTNAIGILPSIGISLEF
jgi:hypothetical protein